jgi:transposase-like protein
MAGHGEKLSRKKENAIAALLTQRTIEDAARATGVAARTLRRWLQLPEFHTPYLKARRDTHSQSLARLQQASGAAVSTLLKVMLDPSTPASTRVRAADSVLNHSAKAIESEDIEVRVAELERAAEVSRSLSIR